MTVAPTIERRRAAPPVRPEPVSAPAASWHWVGWLAVGLLGAFAVPFLFADVLELNRDVYYGVYALFVALLCAGWLKSERVDARALLTRNWPWGLALGAACAGVLTLMVVRTEDATSHPEGIAFVAAVVWRGVVYGVTDGVLLSAFPILLVYTALSPRRWRARVVVAALALAVSLVFTAVYHLGYSDFRGDKLGKPVAGDVVWSAPTLLTMSPLGAPIAHAGLHVSAVVHSYDTDTFLPPHRAAGENSRPDLQRILDEITSGPKRLAPGATAYVAWPGGQWSGAAGVASVETGSRMEPDARMRLESVSKIWTATLVLQLVAEGRLELADTVERWLPGMFPFGDRITIQQLLTHTSGMFDDNDAYQFPELTFRRVRDPALRREFLALADRYRANPRLTFSPMFLVRLAASQPLYFEPGQGYHYSNIGFTTLGVIISRVTRKPIAEMFEQRIFRPLGLDNTAYDPQGPIRGPHSRGYSMRPDGSLIDLTDAHPGKAADGGIVSNARETATFLTELMRGRLLPWRVLRGMQAYAFWNGGRLSPCGLVVYGHGGAGGGFKTEVVATGDGGWVAVLLLNGRNADTDAGAPAAVQRLFCAGQDP